MADIDIEEIPAFFEELEALEDDFEDVETQILRQQHELTKDLYVKREQVIAKIPSFWGHVFEHAPVDIDEYIQPSDASLIVNSLTGLSVDRFELPSGDPRSISIKFTFSENEFFENTVLEKKFWFRNANDGWAGLVSEPVDIKWKAGKDLTNGMLDLVKTVYAEEAAGKKDTEAMKKLKEQIENTGMEGVSFFAWFGFRGRKISDEEHKEATKKEEERRALRKAGKKVDDEMDEDEDDDEDEYEWEIFPTADDLAVAISEDLYPGAIKYFFNAQEQDDLSDADFEDDSDEDMGEDGCAHGCKH